MEVLPPVCPSSFHTVTSISNLFCRTQAGSVDTYNKGLTWGQQALRNAEYIMGKTKAFYSNQIRENLLHIEVDQIVGDWRDSTYGMHIRFL
jgi:hypothetical protein